MPSIPTNALHDFTLLVKPSGAACNLACRYCFYLDKAELYPGSPMRMPEEVLQAYIKQYLHSQHGDEVTVAWQGGEPTLMGLEFFRRSVELVKKYRRAGQRVLYSMQTNGTMLDDAWCDFFKRNDFLVGLSMDGTRAMHNTYRVNKGGQGSFTQVLRAWELLQMHRVETNILCAVHTANADQPKMLYHYLRDSLGARFIQFIPIVERVQPLEATTVDGMGIQQSEEVVSPRSVKTQQFGRFLIDIFDEWVQHDVGTVFIQAFDAALASWCRLPSSLCVFQEVCGRSLVLEHNGDLYSCDHFVDQSHRLGNILERPLPELVKSAQQRQFGRDKSDRLPAACLKCEVLFACHGECPRNRFVRTTDRVEGLNYLCTGYNAFFKHIDLPMRLMTDLLRQGRPAGEIMQNESRSSPD